MNFYRIRLSSREAFAGLPEDDWRFERVVASDDCVIAYVSTSPGTADVDALVDARSVERVRTLGPGRYECLLDEPPVLGAAARFGRRTTVAVDNGTVVVETTLPDDLVSPLLDHLEAVAADVRLVARKRLPRPARRDLFAEMVDTLHLTRPERATLEAAFFSGYFDDPQQSDASDLATAFGTEEETVVRRIRRAERALLGNLL
ncbi:helix-turn-helix domain-containing protein [Haloarchaeobius sp. TZWWS8]|uniref:helix-turn-helix domain-containing protein n=1 Tax=Haloarchaeobius sp. TZWWS8 TaxID=3446121 RepID=UPI003EBEC3E7